MIENVNDIVTLLRGTELLVDSFSRKAIFELYSHFRSRGYFDIIINNAREVGVKIDVISDVDFSYHIFANFIPNVWWASAKVFCGGDYIETIETTTGDPEYHINKLIDMLKRYYVSNGEEFDEQVQASGWWKVS